MAEKPITLLALNSKIKSVLTNGMEAHWVSAEINELKVNYSGHCYLELIQKDEGSEKIIARTRAIIWAQTYRMIQPYFESTTGQEFSSGIKIMVKASVNYSELYGLSLNIFDIEPTYTVGELAIRKQQIIKKLEEEGVIHMNKEVELPTLIQRIAVISSKTAAGLGDFQEQLKNNPYHLFFDTTLFPAVMQGAEAETSIIEAFDLIFGQENKFDVVVLIRGGGSQTDLECFNSYWLAYHMAQFPIPVFTGIGHEQDDTIADLVAHTRLKTPTAVAEYLISIQLEHQQYLRDISNHFISLITEQLNSEANALKDRTNKLYTQVNKYVFKAERKLDQFTHKTKDASMGWIILAERLLDKKQLALLNATKNLLAKNQVRTDYYAKNLKSNTLHLLQQKQSFLKEEELKLKAINPEELLKKGFTLTFKDGKLLTSTEGLEKGDILVTQFANGNITSKIEEKK